jgi:hypothetical protein
MSEENQTTNPILVDTIIAKVQKQDQRIQGQEEKVTQLENTVKVIPEHASSIAEIQKDTQDILAIGNEQKTMMERLQKFFTALEITTHLLRHPTPAKVEHHHHFPKITWITAGLFLALCLVSSGWYMTVQSSEQYQANDIKYRELKLEADSAFRQYLYHLDSLYLMNPEKMTKFVKEQELLREKSLELSNQLQAVNKSIGSDLKTGKQSKKGK